MQKCVVVGIIGAVGAACLAAPAVAAPAGVGRYQKISDTEGG